MISNPLTVHADADLVEVGRLYVLTRDAYLSTPEATRAKLAALQDLRHVVADHLTDAGIPTDLTTVGGVRLVETLRTALRRMARGVSVHDRALVLVEILTSGAPGAGMPWAAARVALGVDLAGHLAPEVTPAAVDHVLRRQRAMLRTLHASTGRGRGRVEPPEELSWVADTLAAVFALAPAAAAVAAVRALDAPGGGGAERVTQHGIAGGALFEPIAGVPASGPRAFVGGVLADTFPDAFGYHLATLDVAAHARADLRPSVVAALGTLRADLLADPDRPVRGSVRALDLVTRRLDGRHRLRADRHVRCARPGLHLP